jgi:hypothetical protein
MSVYSECLVPLVSRNEVMTMREKILEDAIKTMMIPGFQVKEGIDVASRDDPSLNRVIDCR